VAIGQVDVTPGGISRLRVGIQLPGSERAVTWPEYLAMARAAEEIGFDSIRLGDHLLYRGDGRPERGPMEVWTLLGALAASTSRIRLGPLVACVSFHHPGLIAKMATTIDAVSDGRLVLGLGAGWNQPEYQAFGLPFDRRVARFEESLRIVRRLLDGDRVTLRGRYWSVDEALLAPAPRRRVPLMVGSNGDRMLAVALPHVDWWNSWYSDYGNTADGYAALHARISSAAERAGREPGDVARSVGVLVDHEPRPGGRPASVPGERPLPLAELPAHLRTLAEIGADEAVIVMHTMTEQTIRAAGAALRAGTTATPSRRA
jgi:alkanesulfonate monooxygenase SsuD/methylene tetrahydromethanopterin reductase-like flavin-dependent oxidoreductase (luciferase family)